MQLNLGNTPIDRVSDFNCLGLTINEHINWKSHIYKLANKISKTMGVLNKSKRFARMIRYDPLIRSSLNYGTLAWDYICERRTKLHKDIVIILRLSKYNTYTEPIFETKDTKSKCHYQTIRTEILVLT